MTVKGTILMTVFLTRLARYGKAMLGVRFQPEEHLRQSRKVVKNSNDKTIQPLTINLNFKLKQTTVPKLDTLFH